MIRADPAPQESADTFAESIGARLPLAVPLDVTRKRLDAMYTVSEEDII